VIGLLKQKYSILQGVLPINFISSNNDNDVAVVDKIVKVCCARINMCPSVVPLE